MKKLFLLTLIISMLHFPATLGQEKQEMPADICAFKLDEHSSVDSLWTRSFRNSKKIKARFEKALSSVNTGKVQNLFLKEFSDMHEFSVVDLRHFLESHQTSTTKLTKNELKELWDAIQECSRRSNEVYLKYKSCKIRFDELEKEFERLKAVASITDISTTTSQIELQYALRKHQRELDVAIEALAASKKDIDNLMNGN